MLCHKCHGGKQDRQRGTRSATKWELRIGLGEEVKFQQRFKDKEMNHVNICRQQYKSIKALGQKIA